MTYRRAAVLSVSGTILGILRSTVLALRRGAVLVMGSVSAMLDA